MLSCSNSGDSTTIEKSNIKEKKLISKEKNQTTEETIMSEMGFDFGDEKIIIDINKTNDFFSTMKKRMEDKVKEIENKIIKADINITRDGGFVVKDEKISIDLNHTKNLLNDISELFEEIILDINRTIN
jgi:hypothetical protein